MWLGCAGLLAYALFGKLSAFKDVVRLKMRTIIWWIAILVWTVACAYVFARNITMAVFVESMQRAGLAAGGIALFLGGLVGIAWIFSFPARRRQKQAAADYAGIDEASRQEMLDLIDSHSRQGDFILMYRPDEKPTAPFLAHVLAATLPHFPMKLGQ